MLLKTYDLEEMMTLRISEGGIGIKSFQIFKDILNAT